VDSLTRSQQPAQQIGSLRMHLGGILASVPFLAVTLSHSGEADINRRAKPAGSVENDPERS
jgi:hypothetical protein